MQNFLNSIPFSLVIDPLLLTQVTQKLVCRAGERKYLRFRATKFYGGSATADCIGCNLRCIYCWFWNKNVRPERYGKFYSPEEVAKKLVSIAKRRGFRYVRVSGGEPTLCPDHLLAVLEKIPGELTFILETNGILIDRRFARALSKFDNLLVRVSIKGDCPEVFSFVTLAEPQFFEFQVRAVWNLFEEEVPVRVAYMVGFSDPEKLSKILPPVFLEPEYLMDYGGALERLKKYMQIYERSPHEQ